MKNIDIIRKVFRTLTFILFIIQFQQSIRKYFQYPVVEQTSRISVKKLPNPVVYVCHESQFNYTKALDNGYKSMNRFMSGIMVNSTNISWRGKWVNATYKDLENILFDFDYSSITSKTLLSFTNLWNFNERKRTLLFPHGICMEIVNLQQFTTIAIYSKANFNVYFVDPARANNIRTEETLGAKAKSGPTTKNLFSYGIYELEYALYDNSIHDGTSCTDYSKSEMTYGECLNKVLTQEFLSTYGCLPPWVSTNNSKILCEEETNIDAVAIQETPFKKNIVKLAENLKADMFKKCLSPCTTMKMTLQEVAYRSNWLKRSFLKLASKIGQQFTNR